VYQQIMSEDNRFLDWCDGQIKLHDSLAREHFKDKEFLRENLFTSDELYFSLKKKSGGVFDASKFEEQRKGAIKVVMTDKVFWDMADTMSICDYCKTVTMQEPRMMICGSCKGRHYCSKGCQKKDWKAGHKQVCAAEFAAAKQSKTTRLCQKIMALLSLDVRPGEPLVLNSWAGRFKQHLMRFGVRGAIYVPVCDSVELLFIPMPLDVVDILLPATPECKFSYGNAIELSHDNPTAMLLIPTKEPSSDQNLGVWENTVVHAFLSQSLPTKKVTRLHKPIFTGRK